MSSRILVCAYDEVIAGGVRGHSLVVRLDAPDRISAAARSIRQDNILHAILLETKCPLSQVPFDKSWRELPIALYTPGMGDFREVAGRLPLLREMNMRVFMPAHIGESYTSLRILSSLKIASGLFFPHVRPTGTPWPISSPMPPMAGFPMRPSSRFIT